MDNFIWELIERKVKDKDLDEHKLYTFKKKKKTVERFIVDLFLKQDGSNGTLYTYLFNRFLDLKLTTISFSIKSVLLFSYLLSS